MKNFLSATAAVAGKRLASYMLVFCLISVLSVYAQTTVTINVGDNINDKVKANPAGTTYLIKAGVHRMQDVTPKSGDKFIGEPGAILNGSRLLTAWVKEGPFWVHTGQTQQGQRYEACVDNYTGCKYPEDLYKNDYPLRQDTVLGLVGPGEWYFDYTNDKVYMYDDPTGHKMEIGVSRRAFGGPATNVTIKGLIVEKYAIPGHMAAIGDQRPGEGWIIENNEVRLNHGQGIGFKGKAIVRGNYVHHNGQMGIGGGGVGALVENNEISFNTLPEIGYAWGHEGGGTKFAVTDSLILRNNYAHDNWGPGLWTDISNIHTIIEGNRCINNLASGIFHEISYDAIIRCNTVSGNARAHGAQIFLSTSRNVEIYNNKVTIDANSGNGITVVQRNRGGDYTGVNNYVHHNDITYLVNRRSSGAAADYNVADFWATGNNRFNYNTYHVPAVADVSQQKLWEWNGALQNWAGLRALGQEANGSVDNNLSASTAPVANAGTDKTITLPATSVALSGASTGPFTSTYYWTQTSGPNTAVFSNPTVLNPTVSNLLAGTYLFRLTVTSACSNTTASDEVTVVVNGGATLYEAETNYSVVTDADGDIGTPGCNGLSNNRATSIFDVGDKIRINFSVATAGSYRVSVRLRSGYLNSPTAYWPNSYAFTVDNTVQTFTGDAASVSAPNPCLGNTYWGNMNSPAINLTAGQHFVTIEAKGTWGAVDYVEIKPITASSRLAFESTATRLLSSFPNPFEDKITLDVSSLPGGTYTISMSDAVGKPYYSQKHTLHAEETQLTIDLSGKSLPSGLYILKVNSVTGTFNEKVSKVLKR